MHGAYIKLLHRLKSFYSDSKACARINDKLSDWFDMSKGV